jgi:DNA-binding CsgD family transcriptional regulator
MTTNYEPLDLSDRQREIAALVAQGLSNPEIGKRLYLATDTVKTHICALLARLGIQNRTQLAAVYARDVALRERLRAVKVDPRYARQVFVPKRITGYRQIAGLTRGELALRMGCSVSMLDKCISGAVPPRADFLARLADVLGVSVGDLFTYQPL